MTISTNPNTRGVRDIEAIRLRCFCDPDTGCWHYRGTYQKRHNKPGREPMVWMAEEGFTTTLMRASWSLAKRRPVPDGHMVWRRCLKNDCGNPAHLLCGTKKEWGAWLVRQGHLRGRPERSLINRRIKQDIGHTSLTMELASWARESQQNGREVAHALDVKPSVVSNVRAGRTFRPAAASSVFALGLVGQS